MLPPREQGRRRETSAGRHADKAGRRQKPCQEKTRRLTKAPRVKPAATKSVPLPEPAASDGKPAVAKSAGESGEEAKSARLQASAPKPDQTGKPGPEGGKESKSNAVGPADKAWFRSDKRGQGRGEARSRDGREQGGAQGRTRPSPSRRKSPGPSNAKWRDGTAARLQGANSAYYLTRKIVSTRPRTAIVQIDGPAGFRMWVNGELAQTSLPPPPAAPPRKLTPRQPARRERPGRQERREGRRRQRGARSFPKSTTITLMERWDAAEIIPEKKFRIGLRQGENEIVVKVVFGGRCEPQRPSRLPPQRARRHGRGPRGGGSFTFKITPEGDDVLTHEVATALRLEALNPAAGDVFRLRRIRFGASSSKTASKPPEASARRWPTRAPRASDRNGVECAYDAKTSANQDAR